MKKDEAINLIKSFFTSREFPLDGFNEQNNYFQAMFDEEIVAFSFREDKLICSVLIYEFLRNVKPKVLAEIENGAKIETRGKIKYEEEKQTLYIYKEFTDVIDYKQFIFNMNLLIDAAKNWSNEVLDRIATKAFNHDE
jgi:hypothetical protein